MSLKPRPASHMLILLACFVVRSVSATEALQPPCGGPQMPDYPVAIGAPVVRSETVTGWVAPTCLGWGAAAPTLLVAITGRLHEAGGPIGLLARLGAISRLRGLRYWSVTDQTWQILVIDAYAVTDPGGRSRRGDFRPDEMAPGASLYAAERDGRAADAVIYRMQVIERSADRVVVSIVNATPVRAFKVTLFAPGALQTTYFLDRLGQMNGDFTACGASPRACSRAGMQLPRSTGLWRFIAVWPGFRMTRNRRLRNINHLHFHFHYFMRKFCLTILPWLRS